MLMLDRSRVNANSITSVLIELVADTKYGVSTIVKLKGTNNLLNTDSIVNTLLDTLDLNDSEEIEINLIDMATGKPERIAINLDDSINLISSWVTKIEIVNIQYNDSQ